MNATVNTSYRGRSGNIFEKLVRSKIFWFIICGFFFGYPVTKSMLRQLPPALPVLSQVPTFKFTDENGRGFGSEELKGKVYVANFVFTNCQTVCPVLLSKVQVVQHRLRGVIDRAAIVSFSVDPENDTPAVLFAKAREMNANANVWRFLTGPKDEMKELLIKGFKVPVGDGETAGSIWDIAHSNKFVLVDREGRIRGYYSSDKDGINQMMIDTGLLINQPKSLN